MKSILLFLSIFLFFGACQKEEMLPAPSVEPVAVEIISSVGTVEFRDLYPESRSGDGSLNQVDPQKYNLRFILEIFEGEKSLGQYYQIVPVSERPNVRFQLRLVPGSYRFAFWADYVDKRALVSDGIGVSVAYDLFYQTSSLKDVVFSTDTQSERGNQTAKDAFTAVSDLEITNMTVPLLEVVLRRPFAKVQLVSTDMGSFQALPTDRIRVTWRGLIGAAYDVARQQEKLTEGIAFREVAFEESMPLSDSESLVLWDYLLPSDAKTDVEIATYRGKNQIASRSAQKLPLFANRITTLKGNFFTQSGEENPDINGVYSRFEEFFADPDIQSYSDWLTGSGGNNTALADLTWKDGLIDVVIENGMLSNRKTTNASFAWATPPIRIDGNTAICFSASADRSYKWEDFEVALMDQTGKIVGVTKGINLSNTAVYNGKFRLADFSLDSSSVEAGIYRVVFSYNKSGQLRGFLDNVVVGPEL